jgi:hypothetical protein
VLLSYDQPLFDTAIHQRFLPIWHLSFFHTANHGFLISWWNDVNTIFPSLHLYTFDTLAIPAMSAEYERVFSSAKNLNAPERNRLAEDIIEASECLKNWWDRGLIQQLEDGEEI